MGTEIYYYVRDAKEKLLACVCLMENEGLYRRGVALCSARDQFSRKIGRKIAYGRAVSAPKSMKQIAHVNTPAARELRMIHPGIHYTSEIMSPGLLSDFEKKLVSRLEESQPAEKPVGNAKQGFKEFVNFCKEHNIDLTERAEENKESKNDQTSNL